MGLHQQDAVPAAGAGFEPKTDVSESRDRSGAASGLKLIPIVAASGFAGLGYEIVWARELSLVLGSEMMAVLGAIAGFFGGLALGAFILDRPLRRAASPRLAYALLEVAIGLWGLVSIWLLPGTARTLPPLLGTEPAPAVLWAISFAIPALVLLPATAAIGGTLAALESMVREARGQSRVTAGVYGANTAGAVAGALASAFLLMPTLGLSGTLVCLVGLNFLCAIGAMMFGPAAAHPAESDSEPARVSSIRLTVALAVTGFLGIAFEVLIVRLASQVLQNTIYTFAGLLAAYLLGTAIGGLAWQRAEARTQDAHLTGLLAITSLSCLATAFFAPSIAKLAAHSAGAGIAGELMIALALFLVPSAAMGALFGFLAQRVRDARGSLGWAVGINSVGAALAPLLTVQILIPIFGAWRALIPIALGYLLLLPRPRAALLWAAAPIAAGAMLLLGAAPLFTHVLPGGTLLALRDGPMLTASAVEDAGHVRYLEVNGHFRMGGTSSMRSDYRQAMLPLLLHPAPRDALFLGIGTGATIVGGAQMPRVSVRGVELSPEVVDLLPWFADPAVKGPAPPITVADARRYVVADKAQHDVIIADLFHPALDGSGSLYTIEHFKAVRERLAADGVFCQWLPLYQLDLPSLQTIIRGFLDVYPHTSAWLNHYSVGTPMLALIGRRNGGQLDLDALAARLKDPDIGRVARPLGFETPIDLLGQHLGGPRALAAFAGDGPRNTDDYPFVTFDAFRNVRALSAPPSTLLLQVIRSIQPDPAEMLAEPKRAELSARLAAYWRARNRFLEAGAALQGEPRGIALVEAASPGLLDSVRLSPEFEPAYAPLISMAKALIRSDRAAAARLLHAIVEAAPSRREARDLLASEFRQQ
jgi:spermidine synthase